jgi:hypothetical protein
MAQEAGFLDPSQITIDVASGAVAGAVAYPVSSALTKVAQELGLLDKTFQITPVWTIQYLPDGSPTIYAGRTTITLPRDIYNAYLIILIEKGPESAARWLFNQVRMHLRERLEEQADGATP